MMSSITAVRSYAAAGAFAIAVGLLGATPVAAAEPELTITLPVALVVGDPDYTLPSPATITGCPSGLVLDVKMTRFDDDGRGIGHPLTSHGVVPSGGTYPLSLDSGAGIFYGPGILSTGSIVIDTECADTGESTTATIPVMPLTVSLPTGVSVLSIVEHGSTPDALVSGCPGGFRIETSYSYPLGEDGGEVTVPISLVPLVEAQPDGTLPFSLQPIKTWLGTQQPNRNGSIQIMVSCYLLTGDTSFPWVARVTVTIPPGLSLGGSEPPAPPVGRPGSAAPSAAGSPAPTLESNTLSATGVPTAAQSLVCLALLLLGAVATLVSRRRRLTGAH